MAALALNLITLLRQRQAIDFDHIVEHARERPDNLAVVVPVKACLVRKRVDDETREIYRAQQAGSVRRQRLLATGIGCADVFAKPVIVHFIDLVDQNEAGLRKIVGRCHDQVPHPVCRYGFVNFTGDQAITIAYVTARIGPLAPDELRTIRDIELILLKLLLRHGKRKLPIFFIDHRLHEFVRNKQ